MTEQKRLSCMFAERAAKDGNPEDVALAKEARRIYEMALKSAAENVALHPQK
jgi:hypothetical protein